MDKAEEWSNYALLAVRALQRRYCMLGDTSEQFTTWVPHAADAFFGLSTGAYAQNWLHQQKLIPTSSWPEIGRGWML